MFGRNEEPDSPRFQKLDIAKKAAAKNRTYNRITI